MTEVAQWIVDAFQAYCRGEDAGVRLKFQDKEYPARVVCIDSDPSLSVLVVYRYGDVELTRWVNCTGTDNYATLLPPKPKPLEGWVNVYPDGCISGLYRSAEHAIAGNANSTATRTAVHMREVVEEDGQ